jgi:hypothetical protein
MELVSDKTRLLLGFLPESFIRKYQDGSPPVPMLAGRVRDEVVIAIHDQTMPGPVREFMGRWVEEFTDQDWVDVARTMKYEW